MATLFLSLLATSLIPAVSAQFTLTSAGCADPSGFDSCWSSATSQAEQCYQQNCEGSGVCTDPLNCYTNNANCATACVCVAHQEWINCATSHCWNRAYSCEYQTYLVTAIQACDAFLAIEYPPYWPAPAGQAGSCSCELETIFAAVYDAYGEEPKCSAKGGKDCSCCEASQALSVFPAACGNSNFTQIYSLYEGMSALNGAINEVDGTECQSKFAAGTDCSQMGFSLPAGAQFYTNANDIPVGSSPVTNSPGQLETPLAATTVWSFAQGLAPVTATAAALGSGTTSGSSGSGSSGSGSGSQSSGNSAADGLRANGMILHLVVLMGTLAALW